MTCAICRLDKIQERTYDFRHHLAALRHQQAMLGEPVLAPGGDAHASCVTALRDKYLRLAKRRGIKLTGETPCAS